MLKNLFLGIPVWTWLSCIILLILFKCNLKNKRAQKSIKKVEKFADENSLTVYNFNTEWCGWSQKFQPEWDQFASMTANTNINAKDIKCDKPENENMCKSYNVPGFPSVVIEKDNKKMLYDGERTAKALMNHCNNL